MCLSRLFISLFATVIFAEKAFADLFYYTFEAEVTEVTNNEGNYLGHLPTGSIVTGKFSYSREHQSNGTYPSGEIEISIPTKTFLVHETDLIYTRWTVNGFSFGYDQDSGSVSEWTFSSFRINFSSYIPSPRPPNPPELISVEDFESAQLTIKGRHNETDYAFGFEAQITKLTLLNPSTDPDPDPDPDPEPEPIPPVAKEAFYYHDAGYVTRHNHADYDVFQGRVDTVAFAKYGKVYIAGYFERGMEGDPALEEYYGIHRVQPDGTIDPRFDVAGGFTSLGDEIRQMGILQNGDIFVVGDFDYYAGVYVGNVLRLNPDGSIDPDFLRNAKKLGSQMGTDGAVDSFFQLPDGDIILVGAFSVSSGQPIHSVSRITTVGDAVESWRTTYPLSDGTHGNVHTAVYSTTLDRIVIGGDFTISQNGSQYKNLALLDGTGQMDENYVSGLPDYPIHELKQMSDTRICFHDLVADQYVWVDLEEGELGANNFPQTADASEGFYNVIPIGHDSLLLVHDWIFLADTPGDPLRNGVTTFSIVHTDGSSSTLGRPYVSATSLEGTMHDGVIWLWGDIEMIVVSADPEPEGAVGFLARMVQATLYGNDDVADLPPFYFDRETITLTEGASTMYVPIVRSGTPEELGESIMIRVREHPELADYFHFPAYRGHDYHLNFSLDPGITFPPKAKVVTVAVTAFDDTSLHEPQHQTEEFRVYIVEESNEIPEDNSPNILGAQILDSTPDEEEELLKAFGTDGTSETARDGDYDLDGIKNAVELFAKTNPAVADALPTPRIFVRHHPQDNAPVWVLETSVGGNFYNGAFDIEKGRVSPESGKIEWETVYEYYGVYPFELPLIYLEWDASMKGGFPSPFLYGDLGTDSTVGIRLDTEDTDAETFWRLKYHYYTFPVGGLTPPETP